eukprot:475943_1
MAKLLIECVQCYGHSLVANEKFYRGVNNQFLFKKFVTRYRIPLSTTSDFVIATEFAGTYGLVMEIGKYDFAGAVSCFYCCSISWFDREREVLFFGGDCILQINCIYQMNNDTGNWSSYRHYIGGIRGILSMVKGSLTADNLNSYEKNEMTNMLQYLLFKSCNLPLYIIQLLNYHLENIPHEIEYDWSELVEQESFTWLDCIFIKNKQTSPLLNSANICNLFSNCNHIIITMPQFYIMNDAFCTELIQDIQNIKDGALIEFKWPSSVVINDNMKTITRFYNKFSALNVYIYPINSKQTSITLSVPKYNEMELKTNDYVDDEFKLEFKFEETDTTPKAQSVTPDMFIQPEYGLDFIKFQSVDSSEIDALVIGYIRDHEILCSMNNNQQLYSSSIPDDIVQMILKYYCINPNSAVGQYITCITAEASSLKFRKLKLIDVNDTTAFCVLSRDQSRKYNFPISAIKPEDYIDKIQALFHAMSSSNNATKTPVVEYHDFLIAMQLMGAEYSHEYGLKIFETLDIKANGALSFQQFINWLYGLGIAEGKGKLLTTIECVTGLRKWKDTLTYYVMLTSDSGNECVWVPTKYNKYKSSNDEAYLVTENENNLCLVPKNLQVFETNFKAKILNAAGKAKPIYVPSSNKHGKINIVVMGAGAIGKTSLIKKFVKGVFTYEYDPTKQQVYRKQIVVGNRPAMLNILDTAGQDEFVSMRYDWLNRNCDVLLICFSRSSYESFANAKELIIIVKRLLRQHKIPRIVPILLVGTKHDLVLNRTEVTMNDIAELQQQHDGIEFIRYIECSAFMNENVVNVFQQAVIMYRTWNSGNVEVEIIYNEEKQQTKVLYVQEADNAANMGRAKCIDCLELFCPALAAYIGADRSDMHTAFTNINVSKDTFGDELSELSYAKQRFFVKRKLSLDKLLYCVIAAVFFPIVITWQTLYFVFYCHATNCCFKCLSDDRDFTDLQIQLLYDFFAPIVGRDPRDSAKSDDGRKFFLSQTCFQKLSRIFLMMLIDILFFFAWYNAITVGFGWFGENSDRGVELSILETLGPQQLWLLIWLIIALYISLEIKLTPDPPSMQSLRPYVMYLNEDESIRTTAYVFLRGFSKSTLTIFRLEATGERIVTSLIVAFIWILIPGTIRMVFKVDGGGLFFPDGLLLEAISAMFILFTFVFLLVLSVQMQLMSGLENYINWMNAITSMLDKTFSNEQSLHYINLVRHNNILAWIEMRTYLYTNGLIIFSRQEIFVYYVIFIQTASAMYVLWRLFSGTGIDDTYGSPSFVGMLILFLALTYAMFRVMRPMRRLEKLQANQIALLTAQKFQISHSRIKLKRFEDVSYDGLFKNIHNGSRFTAGYLDNSEKFIQMAIDTCKQQDIIPRLFNIKAHPVIGLTILCTSFIVIPSASRLAFGSDCADWSD